MTTPEPSDARETPTPPDTAPPEPTRSVEPMPRQWRIGLILGVLILTALAYGSHYLLGSLPRLQALFGIVTFLALCAALSKNLRAVKWNTLAWGLGIQLVLAIAITQVPVVRQGFEWVGGGIKLLIDCSDKGSEFVFGNLGKIQDPHGFVFAFRALPPIIFVSSFFSVLYFFGVLQFLVKLFARLMMKVMGTSGAETLSAVANVFMGQTEAPLIVKPYVRRMTESELLALMAGGMATVSGGMMAIYLAAGADPALLLCTSVMACPCSLYLSKLLLPELAEPVTSGKATIDVKSDAVNPIDAASRGIGDGLMLALNVAAMLIGFLAFIALFDAILASISTALKLDQPLSLGGILGQVFSPVAFLMGVPMGESPIVGQLLGTKLVANEAVAYESFKKFSNASAMSTRSQMLSVFALTGFANFASVGIQLGGIGAMAPDRRADLARLGFRALFVGFLATVLNAAFAGLLLG
jgi:CNT family concentrative nucleoside transporter